MLFRRLCVYLDLLLVDDGLMFVDVGFGLFPCLFSVVFGLFC